MSLLGFEPCLLLVLPVTFRFRDWSRVYPQVSYQVRRSALSAIARPCAPNDSELLRCSFRISASEFSQRPFLGFEGSGNPTQRRHHATSPGPQLRASDAWNFLAVSLLGSIECVADSRGPQRAFSGLGARNRLSLRDLQLNEFRQSVAIR